MTSLTIHLTIESDACFGRGDGVAGLVDQEIEHDSLTGLPFLRGRTLKGLLAEECANVLFALESASPAPVEQYSKAAGNLFGSPGSTRDRAGIMRVGPALLPEQLRRAVASDVGSGRLAAFQVLESLTSIRRQTAVDDASGSPETGTLRSFRVLLRDTMLSSEVTFDRAPTVEERILLGVCVAALRRAGTGRNRGRGRLTAKLSDATTDLTPKCLEDFRRSLAGGPA